MQTFIRTTVLAIGQHRGAPRIYIEGRYLITAVFTPGSRYEATYEPQAILLTLSGGGRTVSGKKHDTVGVIYLRSTDIEDAFGNADRVTVRCGHGKITITLSRTLARHPTRGVIRFHPTSLINERSSPWVLT